MGIVYAAYDPDLDRKVAVKLIRPHSSGGASRALRARLLREAQVMARISHPNVVTVLDVGTLPGTGEHAAPLFVAMEFVTGQTMASWLKANEPSWKLALRMYRAAGRGLAAAHHAGLIHRDFKPSNVLVGRDGRVCVADFGIARSVAEPADDANDPAEVSTGDPALTRDGAVLGTPRYMSPEQHAGSTTDARTDQFSFAIAVWEALYGEHPFPSGLFTDGPTPARRQRRVPARIRRALTRALSADCDQRFRSMDALLAALDPAPRQRRTIAGVIAVAAVVGMVVFAGTTRKRAVAVCADAAAGVDQVWSPTAKQRLRNAFQNSGARFWQASWQRVETTIDAYTDRWQAARADNCEATRVRRAQSAELMTLRNACFDARLADVKALVDVFADVFADADEKMVTRAVDAAHSLPSPASCEDAASMRATFGQSSPETRGKAARLRSELATARTTGNAGKFAAARDLALAAVKRSQAGGLSVVQAEGQLLLAKLYDQLAEYATAETRARRALRLAMQNNLSIVEAKSWMMLAWLVGVRRSKYERGVELVTYASGAVARSGSSGGLVAKLTDGKGAIEASKANHARAAEYFRDAVRMYERDGNSAPGVAAVLVRLGNSLLRNNKLDDASAVLARALAIRRAAFGEKHPFVASVIKSMGDVASRRGDHRGAAKHLRHALSVSEAALGSKHLFNAHILNSLGSALNKLGRQPEAQKAYERSLAIYQATLTGDHPSIANVTNNLGTAYRRGGDYRKALSLYMRSYEMYTRLGRGKHRHIAKVLNGIGNAYIKLNDRKAAIKWHERAQKVWSDTMGAHHPHTAIATFNLAESYFKLGQWKQARARYAKALIAMQRGFKPGHPMVAYPLIGLARVDINTNRAGQALAHLRRALTLLEKRGTPLMRGTARYLLAAALAKTGDKRKAKAMALRARAGLTKLGASGKQTIDEIDVLLKRLR